MAGICRVWEGLSLVPQDWLGSLGCVLEYTHELSNQTTYQKTSLNPWWEHVEPTTDFESSLPTAFPHGSIMSIRVPSMDFDDLRNNIVKTSERRGATWSGQGENRPAI